MAPAVSMVLAEVFSPPIAWRDLRDWRFMPGFQANRKPVSQAGGVPQQAEFLTDAGSWFD